MSQNAKQSPIYSLHIGGHPSPLSGGGIDQCGYTIHVGIDACTCTYHQFSSCAKEPDTCIVILGILISGVIRILIRGSSLISIAHAVYTKTLQNRLGLVNVSGGGGGAIPPQLAE